jgi:DNA ligase-associated metallophosphoesterase
VSVPPAALDEPAGEAVVDFGDCRLRLLAARAAFDEASGSLLVADLHLDRSESARRHGGAAPDGVLLETLDRLESLVGRLNPARVLILGDLLHDARGPQQAVVETVAAWRRRCPVAMGLVGGNHDRAAGRVLGAWAIDDLGPSVRLGRAVLRHDPEPGRMPAVIGGHLHPMAEIARGARRLLLPCFRLARRSLVLPAFTAFARGVRFRPSQEARLFAIAEGRVLELAMDATARPSRHRLPLPSGDASDPIEPPPLRGASAGASGCGEGEKAAWRPSHPGRP